jgi:hypothetical protein
MYGEKPTAVFLLRFKSRPGVGYLTEGVPPGQHFDRSTVKRHYLLERRSWLGIDNQHAVLLRGELINSTDEVTLSTL